MPSAGFSLSCMVCHRTAYTVLSMKAESDHAVYHVGNLPMGAVLPKPRQVEYQGWELGLFLHFGIRTFCEGFVDMDERRMSAEEFDPSELDCENWAKTASDAGFKYVVLTAKHHDGFANWPSNTTPFSVANARWKSGKGDVIAEFTAACRKYGLAIGLYYSPFDADCPAYGDEKAYDDFFITQISELLEPYGKIDVLWFDGCGSAGHTYDWFRIINEIRRMQPGILLFGGYDADIRWIGNEDGHAPIDNRNVNTGVPLGIDSTEKIETEMRWLPGECDARMRERNWFFSDTDEHTVKSLDELMGMYYYSVGRGTNMLLNIGPDRRGLLPDLDAGRLVEFGDEIRRRFNTPILTLDDFTRVGDTWEFKPESRMLIDHIVVSEDITKGEPIRKFVVKANRNPDYTTIILHEGYNVGHKTICRFPAISAYDIAVEVIESDGPVDLQVLDVLYTETT